MEKNNSGYIHRHHYCLCGNFQNIYKKLLGPVSEVVHFKDTRSIHKSQSYFFIINNKQLKKKFKGSKKMKYLGINLTKDALNLLLKYFFKVMQVKKNANKWRDKPCVCTGTSIFQD